MVFASRRGQPPMILRQGGWGVGGLRGLFGRRGIVYHMDSVHDIPRVGQRKVRFKCIVSGKAASSSVRQESAATLFAVLFAWWANIMACRSCKRLSCCCCCLLYIRLACGQVETESLGACDARQPSPLEENNASFAGAPHSSHPRCNHRVRRSNARRPSRVQRGPRGVSSGGSIRGVKGEKRLAFWDFFVSGFRRVYLFRHTNVSSVCIWGEWNCTVPIFRSHGYRLMMDVGVDDGESFPTTRDRLRKRRAPLLLYLPTHARGLTAWRPKRSWTFASRRDLIVQRKKRRFRR